jgi:hypothetical protein
MKPSDSSRQKISNERGERMAAITNNKYKIVLLAEQNVRQSVRGQLYCHNSGIICSKTIKENLELCEERNCGSMSHF